MSHQDNIARIKAVYDALEELAEEVVFVGGATVSLYADRPAGEVRPTVDVDILVELAHYSDYAVIEEKLRQKGFVNDVASGVICRYIVKGIIVDIMPTAEGILGFANQWYAPAFQHAEKVAIGDQYAISIFSAPYFIATKLDAFNDRGENDGRFSTDFEDIVYVLNNRNTIWEEMEAADQDVIEYMKKEFETLLANPYIEEWIGSHLEYSEQNRVRLIAGNLKNFVQSR